NSSDKTNNTAGDITLGGVTAASLNVTGAHSVMLMGSSNISGDISVEALGGNITVADNISGAAILAKASDNIVTAASTALKTNNGNLTLWSDSDNNGAGSISLGDSNTLNTSLNGASTSQATGGGKITLAGGLDTNADAIPDGYAISASSHGIGIGSNTSPAESTSNTTLYSGGGDVFIKGKTTATSGALFGLSYNGALTIDSGQGALSITGESAALYGIAFSLNKTSGQGLSLTSAKTSGTAISITGVTTATDSYGLTFNNDSTKDVLATGGGAIAINGTGTGSGYGIYLDGTRVLASAGAITVDGGTAGINFAGGIANTIGKLTGTGVESSSSNIIVTGDRFTIGAATTVDTIGTLTVQSSGASFSSALTWPMTNLTASNITGLTLGKSGNTADITVGSATSIAGPISIYGGNIAIDAVLTASGSNTISLTGSGTITDGVSGYVVADKLALLGGNVTLDHASNAIGTLAASGVSGLTYVDSNALTIGTVNPTGISASGQVRIETLSGDLSITENIVTTNTSADALILNAGKSIAAGTATGGNILVTSGKSIEVGDGGTAKLYSGSVASSTGLSSFIGSGSGRFRYASDETTTNYSTALSTGNNAIYREQPTITTTATAASKTYDGVAYSGGNGVTLSGFVNDDTSAILGGTLAYGGTSQGAINADSYTITPSGYTNGLGYALAYTAGTLTIDKAHLTVTADDKSRLYGAANPVLTTTVSGFVNSEDVSVLTGSGIATTLANATTTVGTATITAGAGTLSAANYDFTTLTDGILNVTPAALSITADNASKVAGQTITFAGTEFTSNGLQNGETIGSVLLASLGADVSAVAAGSPYEITASDAGGGTFSAGNYTIAYNKGSLTVTPSPVNAPPVEQIPARIPPPPTTVPDVAPVTPPPLPVPSPALTPAVPDAVSSGRSFVSGGFVDARPLAVNAVEANAFVFPIPQNTFTHSDSKSTILLTVRMVDGSPLPAWMSFDPVKKMISGIPPQGVSGEFDVIVIATDQFGGEARTRLKVRVGK
ncbi:MAG: hypothetical protein J0665_06815, partial [Deltaproteobacteria bacterium]|nr:hypothetical protein [Deltaproteobacteria bacterium]